MKSFFPILILVAMIFATPATADTGQDQWAARIDAIVTAFDIPSATVTVGHGDRIWAHASGLADREAQRIATPDTRYALASVTKPITAVAIMMLADRGLIDLDAPANRYLGDAQIEALVGSADQATVRRLLDHTAGLPMHYNLIYADEPGTRRTLDQTIALYGKIMLEPGRTSRYSNVGYAVLERIIERVSGVPYPTFLENEIFGPLGMESAEIVTAPVLPSNTAARYMADGERVPPFDMDHRGAGGAVMTAADLVRFGRFFLDALEGTSDLLSQAAARDMLTKYFEPDLAEEEYYTLGLVTEMRGGMRSIYHLGSLPGVRAQLLMVPERDLVVAVMLNEMNYPPLYHIVEASIGAFAPDIPMPVSSRLQIPDDARGEWTGHIDLGDYGRLPITLHLDDHYRLRADIDGRTVHVRRLRQSPDDHGHVAITLAGGTLPTSDAMRQPHHLEFMLLRRGDRLQGYALAQRDEQPDRDGGSFAYWTDLERR